MSESVLKTEEKISANWESCIENGMVKAGYGLIGSAMIAQIFFREFVCVVTFAFVVQHCVIKHLYIEV